MNEETDAGRDLATAPRATVELTEEQIAFFSAFVNNQLGNGQNTDEQGEMLRDARRRLSGAIDELEATS